ncbi:hypothetical protein, partial [Okeania hirsuta]|uniref:hypothetical protein n=2 Tax=Okeania TaxID=1458928 RepID=UPI0019606DA7
MKKESGDSNSGDRINIRGDSLRHATSCLQNPNQLWIPRVMGRATPPFKAKYFWSEAQIPYFPSWLPSWLPSWEAGLIHCRQRKILRSTMIG